MEPPSSQRYSATLQIARALHAPHVWCLCGEMLSARALVRSEEEFPIYAHSKIRSRCR